MQGRSGIAMVASALIASGLACQQLNEVGLGSLIQVEEQGPLVVGGRVWIDKNFDGVRQDDEIGATGVPVNLLRADGTLVDSDLTTVEGRFYLNLPQDQEQLIVEVELPQQHIFTLEGIGDEMLDSDVDDVGRTTIITYDFLISNNRDAGIFSTLPTPTPETAVSSAPTESGADVDPLAQTAVQEDQIDGCADMNAPGQFDCSADLKSIQIVFDEMVNQLGITFEFSHPIDLSLLESCAYFNIDKDDGTGTNITDLVGADAAICFSGFDSVAYILRYAPDGTFLGATDATNDEVLVMINHAPDSALTESLVLVFDPATIDQDAIHALIQAQILQPPTLFDVGDPVLSPAAEQEGP